MRNRKPMSVALLLAMQAVAIEHQLFAAAIGVGLLGLLRPAELLKLRIGDLLLPDLGGPRHHVCAIGQDEDVEQRRRRPPARPRDGLRLRAVRATVGSSSRLHVSASIVPEGPVHFRRTWDLILDFLLVPHRFPDGGTLASLRAGGAIHMFLQTENFALVRWRGIFRSHY